jgi:MFS family permease
MFNVPYFFSLVGLQNVAFSSNLIVTGVLIAGILVSFTLVDRVGRRPLLLCGGVIMSSCVFVVGGIGFTIIDGSIGRVLVAMCSIWVFAYALSVAPIGWLSLVENSSPMLRAQTAGIAAVLQSCSGVLFVSFYYSNEDGMLNIAELHCTSDAFRSIRWLGSQNRLLFRSSCCTLYRTGMVYCSGNDGKVLCGTGRTLRASHSCLALCEGTHHCRSNCD